MNFFKTGKQCTREKNILQFNLTPETYVIQRYTHNKIAFNRVCYSHLLLSATGRVIKQ